MELPFGLLDDDAVSDVDVDDDDDDDDGIDNRTHPWNL